MSTPWNRRRKNFWKNLRKQPKIQPDIEKIKYALIICESTRIRWLRKSRRSKVFAIKIKNSTKTLIPARTANKDVNSEVHLRRYELNELSQTANAYHPPRRCRRRDSGNHNSSGKSLHVLCSNIRSHIHAHIKNEKIHLHTLLIH